MISIDFPNFFDIISTDMPKKVLIYLLIFIGFFLCGLLLAFGWQKLFAKKHVEPQQVAPAAPARPAASVRPAPVSHSTASAPPAPTAARPAQPAQPIQQAQPSKTASPADAGSDIILLIDSSGSMKKTDPADYRKEASKLFISLLGPKDRIGVISFGDAATVLSPLAQNSEKNHKALFAAVKKITSKELSTNITDAVRKGFDELKTSQKRGRVLIMMSDGKLALGSREKDEAASAALAALLPELANQQIKLYAVAFTEESDSALLEHMAKATGGFFRFAKEDKDVHVMFASIFEKIKSPDTVPFEGETFTIDREIREATVLVTKKARTALTLLGPSNEKNTASRHAANIAWFESSVFDMVTIQGPSPGTWRVKLSANEGNKVYVLTDLGLKTSFDRSFANRDENIVIDAWLEKQGGRVTERTVLDHTTFSALITGPDHKITTLTLVSGGTTTADPNMSGTYSSSFPITLAGEYSVKLLAQGKTFKREKTLLFKAVEPPAAPVVEQKHGPLPAAVHAPAEKEVSWTTVLLQFLIVNLILAALATGGYILWNKVLKKRGTQ